MVGDLDVLAVSYRRADLLATMISSVAEHLPRGRLHIWDNRSSGTDDVAALAENYPDTYWHFHETNVGFAAAVNAMMRQVSSSQVLLLNPDAELLSDLQLSRTILASDPRLAAVAPWLDEGGTHRPWDNAHREPNLLRQLVSYAGWDDRLHRRPATSMLYDRQPRFISGYLTGACLLISMSAWTSVGEMDQRYFLYGEEADWCRRARDEGWRLRSVPEPGARHHAGGTVAGSAAESRSAELLRTSQIRYLQDHHGVVAAHTFRWATRSIDIVQPAKRRKRKEQRDRD